MTDFVRLEKRDGIAVATLNSPDTRNALSSEREYSAVEAACRDIQNDRTVRVAVLTGAGKAFCAGGNIKAMHEREGWRSARLALPMATSQQLRSWFDFKFAPLAGPQLRKFARPKRGRKRHQVSIPQQGWRNKFAHAKNLRQQREHCKWPP